MEAYEETVIRRNKEEIRWNLYGQRCMILWCFSNMEVKPQTVAHNLRQWKTHLKRIGIKVEEGGHSKLIKALKKIHCEDHETMLKDMRKREEKMLQTEEAIKKLQHMIDIYDTLNLEQKNTMPRKLDMLIILWIAKMVEFAVARIIHALVPTDPKEFRIFLKTEILGIKRVSYVSPETMRWNRDNRNMICTSELFLEKNTNDPMKNPHKLIIIEKEYERGPYYYGRLLEQEMRKHKGSTKEEKILIERGITRIPDQITGRLKPLTRRRLRLINARITKNLRQRGWWSLKTELFLYSIKHRSLFRTQQNQFLENAKTRARHRNPASTAIYTNKGATTEEIIRNLETYERNQSI